MYGEPSRADHGCPAPWRVPCTRPQRGRRLPYARPRPGDSFDLEGLCSADRPAALPAAHVCESTGNLERYGRSNRRLARGCLLSCRCGDRRMSERRAAARHPVVVPALCLRSDGSEFHAVTVDISSEGLRLRSATLPVVDERLICNIRDIGSIQVRVVWAGSCDFAVRVIGTTPSPGDVARRFIELARRQAKLSEVVRVHRRIVPERTAVEVELADGRRVPAQILNLSASGVALSLDTAPALGEIIRVGRRQATVARRIERGVGVAFLEPLEDAAVGEHTVL